MEKVNATYTIREEVKEDFDDFCKKNHYNKSSIIESKIVEFLKEKRGK